MLQLFITYIAGCIGAYNNYKFKTEFIYIFGKSTLSILYKVDIDKACRTYILHIY